MQSLDYPMNREKSERYREANGEIVVTSFWAIAHFIQDCTIACLCSSLMVVTTNWLKGRVSDERIPQDDKIRLKKQTRKQLIVSQEYGIHSRRRYRF